MTLKEQINLSELPIMSEGEYIYGVIQRDVKYYEYETS